ncbi:MAG: hypothetical protein KW793_00175 [Candidatus Doudnabacteria bacterium]|nr:hypothetical protein [Candidatus Doudnabacteria bacterium]
MAKLNEVLSSKNSWKSFVSDRLNFLSLGIALLINIIQWAAIYIKIQPRGLNILLHYNVVYGTDLVDKDIYAFIIPGLAFLFFLFNLLVAYYIYNKEKLASYFLNIANIPVQVIFLVASIVLILAND